MSTPSTSARYLACAALLGGCHAPPAGPLADDVSMQRGRTVYRDLCAPCHGVTGDGRGPGAAQLPQAPRDFQSGTFKFRSTASGERPLVRDVARTVASGLPGTWMPAFGRLLTSQELREVSAYVLAFAPDEPPPQAVVPPLDELQVPADTPRSRERGQRLYQALGCGQCHGAQGRGDGQAAARTVDDSHQKVAPLDLTTGVYKGGPAAADLYRTLVTGLDGTAMPSYAESLADEGDRWALVHYVRSLAQGSAVWRWLHGPRGPWE